MILLLYILYLLYLITYTYYLVKIFILYFRKLYYELWISMCRYLLWSILGRLKITINHYESLFINHYEWLLITHSWLIVSITQMLHVWNIYLQNCVIFGVNVGKYSSTMEHLGHKNIQHPNHQPREPPGVGRGGPGLDLRFLGVARGAGRRGRGTRTRGAVVVPWGATGRCHGMGRYGGHLGENMVDTWWIHG